MAFFIARLRRLNMAAQKSLYLIALVPEVELRSRIRSLKEEMKHRFGASHALKSPAHITLQMPFRRPESFESELNEAMESFALRQSCFELSLNGFDCFPPRVLFVKVENQGEVIELHRQLQNTLENELHLSKQERGSRFHPHMTIATRDLTEEAFLEAWPEFSRRPFDAVFPVRSLFLLKHNGKAWEVYRVFRCLGAESSAASE